ncbi:alpha/beta hydrolase [Dactylosporangium fulvum]|uniref:Alpha/beta hydrolase n=1 Tax=Dactylosporangium fulvum TaxID=53359 RepID=A0ABY5W664_9ACTN|nr:alpha/beta hydrolase [Dactylosporangium fulvum]UWP84831.1 alpha/beta hydrolase [Dactylosporangium fulvum]
MHFVAHGTGIPVLAIHGWTPDHRLMLGCLEPLFARRPGYRRLYPDLPSMGRTPAPPSIASSDDVLAELAAFVTAEFGDSPFLLIGESYGGYLARALARARPAQVLGLALICPIGTKLEHAERTVPQHQVLRPDPDLLASLDPALAEEFSAMAVVQSPETLKRYQDEVRPGLDAADSTAMARIREHWQLSVDPEDGPPFSRPALILTGRQDASVGYADQFALLPHYPRATFAVLDVAGHNLQFEQPELFEALMAEWLDRVAAE